ncbi:hypothetical protein [Microseira wollei]|uniref:Uncharacterized protein n=1 Tax=Microseira wollei NIES-4236 TaxID=2530354 RepID=A0AAV3XB49_9CYAN|nr:hypothetical protein [Microseira wollei]GET38596.1 hypothetical protein MiSe_33540 [Microseira wollei NIES-4236]
MSQAKSISGGVGARQAGCLCHKQNPSLVGWVPDRQDAYTTSKINLLWGRCGTGRMPMPQAKSISCGVGVGQAGCLYHKQNQSLVGWVWDRQDAYVTSKIHLCWGGCPTGRMPMSQAKSISAGVGVGQAGCLYHKKNQSLVEWASRPRILVQ